eukprot:Lithocolla_globosa_v1_NODE_461_length_3991_cov_15.658283.p3 type:complete len:212 gc:universal NODE_461_length_3991_cov_15.658283:730-1365(+)
MEVGQMLSWSTRKQVNLNKIRKHLCTNRKFPFGCSELFITSLFVSKLLLCVLILVLLESSHVVETNLNYVDFQDFFISAVMYLALHVIFFLTKRARPDFFLKDDFFDEVWLEKRWFFNHTITTVMTLTTQTEKREMDQILPVTKKVILLKKSLTSWTMTWTMTWNRKIRMTLFQPALPSPTQTRNDHLPNHTRKQKLLLLQQNFFSSEARR